MRQPESRTGLSMTAILSIVFVVVFALECINDAYLRNHVELDPEWWLALSPEGVRHGWVWQLFTFQFLHATWWHLAMNLISFWWLGNFVENVLGKKRFLIAFFGCGAAGGLLQSLLMLMFPADFGVPVVGASAGVSGLLAIFALLEKDSVIRFNLILPIRAIALLWIWGGISLFFTLVPSIRGGSIAHAAHLGGLLAGMAWVKLGWHRDYIQLPWENWLQRWKTTRRASSFSEKTSLAGARGPGRSDSASAEGEFLGDDVDAILDKISARGINSLTSRERAILEAARKRMAQR